MSLDRLLRGHLASSRRNTSNSAGVTVRPGRGGSRVFSLTPPAPAEPDPIEGLRAELAAQQKARGI